MALRMGRRIQVQIANLNTESLTASSLSCACTATIAADFIPRAIEDDELSFDPKTLAPKPHSSPTRPPIAAASPASIDIPGELPVDEDASREPSNAPANGGEPECRDVNRNLTEPTAPAPTLFDAQPETLPPAEPAVIGHEAL
jgi:hypothetical protein